MRDQEDDPTRSFYEWSHTKKVDRTTKALEANGFKSQFVPDAQSALKAIMEIIREGATVGIGGSMTLNQIGFFEAAHGRGMNLLTPFAQDITPEEAVELRRKIFSCDYFLCSTNAVTEEG